MRDQRYYRLKILLLFGIITLQLLLTCPLKAKELDFQFVINGPSPDEDFNDPTGLFYDSKYQRLYVYDKGNAKIYGFTLQGAGVGEMEASGPAALDQDGKFYMIVEGSDEIRIQRFTSVQRTKTFGTLGGKNPTAFSRITRDEKNQFYVVDSGNQRVLILDADLNLLRMVGGPERGDGGIIEIGGVAVDRRGTIFCTDARGTPIHIFERNNLIPRGIGISGSQDSCFFNPQGIALDRFGQIWIADTNSGKIKVGDSSGWVVRTFGEYGQGRGQFFKPVDIAVDTYSRIYVLERGSKRLQAFSQRDPSRSFRSNPGSRGPMDSGF